VPFLAGAKTVRLPRDRARATIAVLTTLIGLLPQDALAYIDPGYGVLLVQAILSGFFGFLFLARNTVRRVLTRLFGRKAPTTSAAAERPDTSSSEPGSPG
jgi:hypothetical protein